MSVSLFVHSYDLFLFFNIQIYLVSLSPHFAESARPETRPFAFCLRIFLSSCRPACVSVCETAAGPADSSAAYE